MCSAARYSGWALYSFRLPASSGTSHGKRKYCTCDMVRRGMLIQLILSFAMVAQDTVSLELFGDKTAPKLLYFVLEKELLNFIETAPRRKGCKVCVCVCVYLGVLVILPDAKWIA